MTKRILDCKASDFAEMSGRELKEAIYAAEGRTVLSENAVTQIPVVDGVTNSEIAAFAGTDLILLNAIDLENLQVQGLELTENPILKLKQLTGRPIGVNLEPVDTKNIMGNQTIISNGRQANEKTIKLAEKLKIDFICLTGNPGTGVNNQQLLDAIGIAKKNFSGLVIAGKMHSSGVDEPVINKEVASQFIEAGIDVLLIPALYTVPGFSTNDMDEILQVVKKHNARQSIDDKVLTMAAIGTSQESSNAEVIRKIALEDKALGIDIHHIGDAGYSGLALYNNIDVLGNAIRGERHQLRRRAQSILR